MTNSIKINNILIQEKIVVQIFKIISTNTFQTIAKFDRNSNSPQLAT